MNAYFFHETQQDLKDERYRGTVLWTVSTASDQAPQRASQVLSPRPNSTNPNPELIGEGFGFSFYFDYQNYNEKQKNKIRRFLFKRNLVTGVLGKKRLHAMFT